MAGQYSYKFSHEFDEGPSGPARSYWRINGPGAARYAPLVCLRPNIDARAEIQIQDICYMLNSAYEEGQESKAREVRAVLGIRP